MRPGRLPSRRGILLLLLFLAAALAGRELGGLLPVRQHPASDLPAGPPAPVPSPPPAAGKLDARAALPGLPGSPPGEPVTAPRPFVRTGAAGGRAENTPGVRPAEAALPPRPVPVSPRPAPRSLAPAATPAPIAPRPSRRIQEHEATTAAARPAPAAPPPPSPVAESRGSLTRVECGTSSFALAGPTGETVFSATPATAIRAGEERVQEVCGLQRFIGAAVVVSWVRIGAQRRAGRVAVLGRPIRRATLAPREPSNDGPATIVVTGVVTARTADAVLVASGGRSRPVAVLPETQVAGLRRTFAEIAPFDTVRVSGWTTHMGTLVAVRIEVLRVPDTLVVGRIAAVGPGFVVVGGSRPVAASGDRTMLGSGQLGVSADLRVGVAGPSAGGTLSFGGTGPVSAGVSVSAGSSVGGGGPAGVGGGAELAAGGVEVSIH